MAKLTIEIDTTVDSEKMILKYATALHVLGGGVFDVTSEVPTQSTAVTAPEPENKTGNTKKAEKVTVTDTTDEQATNSDDAPEEETADEKRKRERRERDAKRKAEKEAEKNSKVDESKSDEGSDDDGEKSIEDYKALIRPLLTSKAKEVEGGREKIRAKFDSLGASGLGALADENVKEFYEFISAL